MTFTAIVSPKAMLKANKAPITSERVAAPSHTTARCTQGAASYGNLTLCASTDSTTTFELSFDYFISG